MLRSTKSNKVDDATSESVIKVDATSESVIKVDATSIAIRECLMELDRAPRGIASISHTFTLTMLSRCCDVVRSRYRCLFFFFALVHSTVLLPYASH